MTFRVGMKVVCVDAGSWPQISNGSVYTIHSIGSAFGCWLRLAEAKPELGGYCASRFRPLVETKSSASFTIGADPESERWDNRKKRKEKV